MNKHTNGPWIPGVSVIAKGDGSVSHQFVTLMDGSVVASAHGNCTVKTDAEIFANVRLIAAAPELLHALTMVRDAEMDARENGCGCIPDAALQCIQDAICKANGDPGWTPA